MNMTTGISIIICNYNATLSDILLTISSAIKQKDINFEILFCDDCSKTNYKDEISSFFKKHNFKDYKFLISESNQGTVKNFLNGVQNAKYDYVKPIGCGDLFYNEKVCADIVSFMKENKLHLAFCDAVYFTKENDEMNTYNRSQPFIKDIYSLGKQNYKAIFHNLMLYHDFILGASLFYEKNKCLEYLEKFSGKVIYEEDIINVVSIAEGSKVAYYPQYGIFYEYSGGVSKPSNTSFRDKLDNDTLTVISYIKENINKRIGKKSAQLMLARKHGNLAMFLRYPKIYFFKKKCQKVLKENKPTPSFTFFNYCESEVQ